MGPKLIEISPLGTKAIKVKTLETDCLIGSLHFHELCELVWIEKGQGTCIVGDYVGVFEDNQLVLMAPDLPHVWQNTADLISKELNKVKATVIYFPPDCLLNLTSDQNTLNFMDSLIKKTGRGLQFHGATKRKVTRILTNLPQKKGVDRLISFLRIIDILSLSNEYEYLAGITFKNPYDEKDNNRINKVYHFLIQNFQTDISLKEVADLCYMTTNSFCRFFRERTQKSLSQFVNEIRVGHACKLLQNSQYSIAKVCYASGYNNFTNFHKAFKQIVGMRPMEYRQHLQDQQKSEKVCVGLI